MTKQLPYQIDEKIATDSKCHFWIFIQRTNIRTQLCIWLPYSLQNICYTLDILSKCTLMDEWIRKCGILHTMKEWIRKSKFTICYNMDEPWGHCAKLIIEGQILHDPTYREGSKRVKSSIETGRRAMGASRLKGGNCSCSNGIEFTIMQEKIVLEIWCMMYNVVLIANTTDYILKI